MKDSEFYPVSFFSESFDLVQKIQSDFHALEADQVELFATQMKKHQALVLSIHQQMRKIESDADNGATPETAPKPEEQKNAAPAGNVPKPVQPETKAAPLPETPKGESEKAEESAEAQTMAAKNAENPLAANGILSIEEPMAAPKKNEQTIQQPADTGICPPTQKTGTEEGPKPFAAAKQTIKDVIESKMPASPAPNGALSDGGAPPSVNDAIEKKKFSDLRKAFSLNDKFRYRRELFAGSEDAMNNVITALNHKESYEESLKYLEEKLHWDFSHPTVKDFMKILEIRFL